jgi:folate-dependent phosphoribosylglycinamide formyltransferase PurN
MIVVAPFFDTSKGIMNVAGFMSGKGSNLVKIIEHEQKLEKERGKAPYHVAVIFTDNPKSSAAEIGSRFAIPTIVYDLESFCAKKRAPIKDMNARAEYELEVMKTLREFECDVAAYAGYMRRATDIFVGSFVGVNVHPADLTIKGNDGKPKYRGDNAVRDAIRAGENKIRSTTHLVSNEVDCGGILMVSPAVNVECNLVKLSEAGIKGIASRYQDVLKEKGDWVIFPRTLEYIADKRFEREIGSPDLYFDKKLIPNGIRVE